LKKIRTICEQEKDVTEFYKRTDCNSYQSFCKECKKAISTQWKADNKEKTLSYIRKYNEVHKNEVRERGEKSRVEKRTLVLNHYGGKCACCGESNYEFLAVDHINGNGNKHRKTIGQHIVRWIIENNYPEGFRILCHNCNQSLGLYGYCPHNK